MVAFFTGFSHYQSQNHIAAWSCYLHFKFLAGKKEEVIMPNRDLCYVPAIELAAAIRARRLSPVELTTAILDRIAQLNPKLNAYCTVVPEAALAAARQAEAAVMHGELLGPLHGIRLSFKDLTVTAGIRTTFGSKI